MLRRTLMGLFALLIGAASLSAHENYRIIGTIAKVNGTTVDVKQTKDGKVISMEMIKTSQVTRDKKPVPATELKAGANVVVDAHGDSLDELDVVEIRLVPAPKKK